MTDECRERLAGMFTEPVDLKGVMSVEQEIMSTAIALWVRWTALDGSYRRVYLATVGTRSQAQRILKVIGIGDGRG